MSDGKINRVQAGSGYRMRRPPEVEKSRTRANEHIWAGLRNLNRLRPDWTPEEVLGAVGKHKLLVMQERHFSELPPVGDDELWRQAIGRAKRAEKGEEGSV